jgi:hypothetical protein
VSKNNQRNMSEINLGNETYNRGYSDGLVGNPKTIKKTHRHAHRYHIGYRHGQDQTKRATGAPLTLVSENVAHVHHKLPSSSAPLPTGKPAGFWARFTRWMKS